ncbi:GNAT family N-acetyltransferase [Paenibacillus soyae]|uniref:GNAT family N-acetyltransferase n=1 Tax=Paenibacillus soyae TaxID=2969249 RepID=A0A9X2S881_9BACL|nr:GNAT family protein [Paenibacillus soyae]MCR2803945.1 GNAT family N-acetyltransferase [Paenibacillus soyae]
MKMNHSRLFTGDRIKLTAVREEDADIMAEWGDDAEYLRNVDTDIALPRTREQMAAEGSPDSRQAYFRLRRAEDDRLIGFVAIHSIEWNNRAGLLAIGIGDAADRGQGYGTEALGLILRFAFHELNLDRVGLEVIDYNQAGIRSYEKAGFRLEGRKRAAVYRDGKRHDLIVMGILRTEWEAALT